MNNDLLFKYFMRVTTSEEDRAVREWVEASEHNREEFIKTREFYDLASLMNIAPPAGRQATRPSRPVLRYVVRFSIVAAVCALLVVGVNVLRHENTTQYPNLQALEIPAGQRLRIELYDGTVAWLNSNTRLEFPEKFGNAQRLVSVDGEAYFEVAKDSVNPFVVNTPYGSIKVTGTTFNVDAYSNTGSMVVNLIEGSVSINEHGKEHTLTPGQRISIDKGASKYDDIHEEDLEWIEGIVSFNQLPLRDILKRFEKYYGVHVSYLSKELPDSKFSGKFYIDEGIEQALKTLQRDMDFHYEIDKDKRCVFVR
ncbi:MAG: FecR domain-containing protein [Muribaculaceae bacterium]|nr:FecR domain-containing protein [Muribaculaceae bacterium]